MRLAEKATVHSAQELADRVMAVVTHAAVCTQGASLKRLATYAFKAYSRPDGFYIPVLLLLLLYCLSLLLRVMKAEASLTMKLITSKQAKLLNRSGALLVLRRYTSYVRPAQTLIAHGGSEKAYDGGHQPHRYPEITCV